MIKNLFSYVSFKEMFVMGTVIASLYIIAKPDWYWLFVWIIAGFAGFCLSSIDTRKSAKSLNQRIIDEVEKQLKTRGL